MAETILMPGANAGADLSALQFRFMVATTGNAFEVSGTTVTRQRCIGVLQNDPDTSGDGAEVVLFGVAKITYAGSISAGDRIVSDSVGRAEAFDATGFVQGVALQTGTATGVYFMMVNPSQTT